MAALSYTHSPGKRPLMYKTIPDVLCASMKKENREIFVHYKSDGTRESITNAELNEKSERFARYLVSRGIKPGERIAVCGPNSINRIIAEIGLIMAGGVAVFVSISQSNAADVVDILNIAECKMILIDTGANGEYRNTFSNLLRTVSLQVGLLRKDNSFDEYPNIAEIVDSFLEDIPLPEIYPENSVAMFTTSGSSGKPKIVEHTHFHLTNINLGDVYKLNKVGVTTAYNDRPFGWVGGSPILDIVSGVRRIFLDTSVSMEGSSTGAIWKVIQSEQCDTALLLPYFLDDLLNWKDVDSNGHKLKTIVTGGQVVNRKYLDVMGIFTDVLTIVYGISEAIIVSYLEMESKDMTEVEGNVGNPFQFVEAKVVDRSDKVTPKGTMGEICIRSPFLMIGYLGNEEANKQVSMKGGWFRTGDTGFISEQGNITIKGRTKDVISRGTRKIIPQSIEEKVLQMKGLVHVAVVAIPDDRLYEEVCTCFVSESDDGVSTDDVKSYCEKNFLNKETVDGLGEMPNYFLKFREFPSLPNGKINKRAITAEAVKRLTTSGK